VEQVRIIASIQGKQVTDVARDGGFVLFKKVMEE